MQFIAHQLEGLDPILDNIDHRHAAYLRTSLRQIRYQLGSADGSFKDRLGSLAKMLADLADEGYIDLLAESPGLKQMPVRLPDLHSFYTPPIRRSPFNPEEVILSTLQPDELLSLRSKMMQDVTQAFSPEKVNRKV